jgi:hypothetical protein
MNINFRFINLHDIIKYKIFINFKLHIFKMLKKNLEAIKTGDSNLHEHLVKVLKQMIMNNDK